jgi:hypothetical protein
VSAFRIFYLEQVLLIGKPTQGRQWLSDTFLIPVWAEAVLWVIIGIYQDNIQKVLPPPGLRAVLISQLKLGYQELKRGSLGQCFIENIIVAETHRHRKQP